MKILQALLACLVLTATSARANPISVSFAAQLPLDNITGTWSWDPGQVTAHGEARVTITQFAVNGKEFIASAANYMSSQLLISDSSLFFHSGTPEIPFADGSRFRELAAWIFFLPPGYFDDVRPGTLPFNYDFLNAVTSTRFTLTSGGPVLHGGAGPMTLESPAPVPEPGTLVLLGVGLGGFVMRRRRQLQLQ